MKAAVLGATGYTGMILLRLLDKHPAVEQILPVSGSRSGESLAEVDPGLVFQNPQRWSRCEGKMMDLAAAVAERPDVVFAALPHLESAKLCEPFFDTSVVIDLSADFRHQDVHTFEEAYGHPPPRPDLLNRAVYGLTEWDTDGVRRADLIANPGCYPTSALLPLLPLYQRRLVEGIPVINSLSGISGAGKKAQINLLLTERLENCGAYNPGRRHRHSREIEERLQKVAPGVRVLFQPHLVPMKQGMASTIAVRLADGVGEGAIREALLEAYGGRPFVRLVDRIPQTLDVWGTNRCDIGFAVEEGHLLLFSVLDNLIKGASGQAVQNMNVRFGLPETLGLELSNCV